MPRAEASLALQQRCETWRRRYVHGLLSRMRRANAKMCNQRSMIDWRSVPTSERSTSRVAILNVAEYLNFVSIALCAASRLLYHGAIRDEECSAPNDSSRDRKAATREPSDQGRLGVSLSARPGRRRGSSRSRPSRCGGRLAPSSTSVGGSAGASSRQARPSPRRACGGALLRHLLTIANDGGSSRVKSRRTTGSRRRPPNSRRCRRVCPPS
jgi:hypothetical protein